MESSNEYIPGKSVLVDYAVKHFGAEVINVQKKLPVEPPFPCLTGVYNTNNSFRIDKARYPNIVAAGVDTLELNFGVAEYKELDMFRHLSEVKSEAVSAGYRGRKGKPIDFVRPRIYGASSWLSWRIRIPYPKR